MRTSAAHPVAKQYTANAAPHTTFRHSAIRRSEVQRSARVLAQERKSNKLKDFLDIAGPLGVTHMLSFSNTGAHHRRAFLPLLS